MGSPEAELMIFGKRATRVPIDAILAAVKDRHAQAEWHPGTTIKPADPESWYVGAFAQPGASEPEIAVSSTPLEQWARDEAIEAHDEALTPAWRRHVEASRFEYRLRIADNAATTNLRLLVKVADAIAELADGIILDLASERFFDRTAFRAEHAFLFGQAG